MPTIKVKALLAPELLCQIISPYTAKARVEMLFSKLLEDEVLLDLIIELANRPFLIPTLYTQLHALKLDGRLNGELKSFMLEMTTFMQQRNQSLAELTEELVGIANRHEIIPLLMKGSSALFSKVYPNTSIRFMSDLDILFKPEDTIKFYKILKSSGFNIPEKYQPKELPAYLRADSTVKDLPRGQHLIALYRENDPCAIEIHHLPLTSFLASYLNTVTAYSTASSVKSLFDKNLSAMRMSPDNEIIYCFAHSELAHGYHMSNIFDLRQMDYFVRLVYCYQDKISWENIHSRVKKAGGEAIFQHYLYSINTLFATDFPVYGELISPKTLARKYKKRLCSCFPRYYPKWRLERFFIELTGLLKKQKLSRQYDTDTATALLKARLHYSAVLITKFWNPIKLFNRLRAAF